MAVTPCLVERKFNRHETEGRIRRLKFSMPFTAQALARAIAVLALGSSLGACANVDFQTFRGLDLSDKLRLPSMSAPVVVEQQKPVGADEMVDAEGRCASSPMASATPAPEAAGTDPVTTPNTPALAIGGVGLGMSECEVVKRAGPPDKIEFATSERAERMVTLTYLKNMRPGIYKFVAGRLTSIDRVEVPPEPKPKPVKPPRTAKPKPKPKPAAT